MRVLEENCVRIKIWVELHEHLVCLFVFFNFFGKKPFVYCQSYNGLRILIKNYGLEIAALCPMGQSWGNFAKENIRIQMCIINRDTSQKSCSWISSQTWN